MKVILLFVGLVFLFTLASAETNINSCSVLNVSGEKYVLQNDLNSSGTDCITISADNIVFDANGYNILTDVSNSSGNYGLNVSGTNNSILNFQSIHSYYFSNGSVSFLERNSHGKIQFLRAFSSLGSNLSNEIILSNSFASINSSSSPSFNVMSRIYFYNTPTNFTNATILKDGIICPLSVCVNFTSLNSGNVIFEVPDWANYTLADYGIYVSNNSTNTTIQNGTSQNNASSSSSSSNSNSNSGSSSSSASSIPSSNNSSLNESNVSLANQNVPVNYNYLYGNQLPDLGSSRISGLFTGDFAGNKISGLGLVVLVLIFVIAFLFYVRKRVTKHRSMKHAVQI